MARKITGLRIDFTGRHYALIASYEADRADRTVRRTNTLMAAEAELLGYARLTGLTVTEAETGLSAAR